MVQEAGDHQQDDGGREEEKDAHATEVKGSGRSAVDRRQIGCETLSDEFIEIVSLQNEARHVVA